VIVVDVNVLAYLFIRSDLTGAAEDLRLREPVWAVPFLWRSEFRSVLAGYMRRHLMTLQQAALIHAAASELVEQSEYHVDSQGILELVQDSECSAYDCEYVALALDLDVSLVTMDRKLIRSFPGRAVPLLTP
jgi:predicted nucleic acid-binding protein